MRFHLNNSQNVPWTKSRFLGVSHKFLKLTEDAPQVVDLTLIEKGSSLPPHRHLVMQRSYIVSGTGEALDGTRLEAGSYAEVPPGVRHGTTALDDDVVILNFWESMVTWFLDDGDVVVLQRDGSLASLGKVAAFGDKALPR